MRTIGMLLGGIAAVATMLAGPAAGQTRAAPPAPTGVVSFHGDPGAPDISGLWQGTATGIPGGRVFSNSGNTADGRPPTYFAPWPLPYTPEYQRIEDERAHAETQGRALGDIGARCLPFGLPNMLTSMHYPHEVVQTPGQVTLFLFGTFPITIWTDGRPHPANWTPTYNGHSIGHWEGDTLVVDTIGIMRTAPLDSARHPHGPGLHVQWTIRRVAPNYIHVHITFLDADAFTQPVTITNIWERKTGPQWQILDDQSCFENNQNTPAPAAAEGFIKF